MNRDRYMLPEATFVPYRNMTEKQEQAREQERVRIMLFGSNLISDRVIGNWAGGVTGEELCDYLYSGLARDDTAEMVSKMGVRFTHRRPQ